MRIAVVGGSLSGLVTAILLARSGHAVDVIDRDDLAPAPDVETAAASAFRPGAPQVVQLHTVRPLGRNLVMRHLPDVYAGWMDAGVVEYPLAQQLPPTVADRSPHAGDEDLTILLFRRSTVDWVLRRTAAVEPGVTLHPGLRVTGLEATDAPIPRVTGLYTDNGTISADLVIDASGRRSRLDQWLDAIGARRSDMTAAECGVAYYTRYYRLRPGARLPGSPAMLTTLPLRRFMVAHFGCDNATMGLCLVPLAQDRPLKAARDPAVFTAVLRTIAPVAAWLDVLDPLTEVYPMGDLHNTLRRIVVGGDPVAHGLLTVGDSLCTTNPTFARGIGFAMLAAVQLVDAVASYPLDQLAKVMDEVTSTRIAPWFADQAAIDAARLAAVRGAVLGFGVPPTAAVGVGSGLVGDSIDLASLRWAGEFDPNLFRAQARLLGMLQPAGEILADPGIVEKTREILTAVGPRLLPEPSQEDVAAALAGR